MHHDRVVPVAIVLLNYNGWADTLACLDSLARGTCLAYRIVVCDNASPDGSFNRLREGLRDREVGINELLQGTALKDLRVWRAARRDGDLPGTGSGDAWITLIDNQRNGGFAAGNNVGLTHALRDDTIQWFWLLNNDTEVRPDCLECLTQAVAQRPTIDLWGCTVAYHHQPQSVQALGGGWMNPRTAETRHIGALVSMAGVSDSKEFVADVEGQMSYVLGASMMASRRWLLRVGLLSEKYFLYYEELDWATRGRRAGLEIGYAPVAVVLHKEGASIGTAPSGGSALSVLHLARSRVIYARLWMGGHLLVGVIASLVWRAVKHLLRGRRRQSMAVLKGTWQGLGFGGGV